VALAAGDERAGDINRRLVEPPRCEERKHTFDGEPEPREDSFYWLRDDDRKDEDVLEYLRQENEYTKVMMADTEVLQDVLFKGGC